MNNLNKEKFYALVDESSMLYNSLILIYPWYSYFTNLPSKSTFSQNQSNMVNQLTNLVLCVYFLLKIVHIFAGTLPKFFNSIIQFAAVDELVSLNST